VHGETFPVDESFLAPLGVVRLPVPVPFVEAGGPVNAIALRNADDATWTLFDTGVGTPEGVAALESGAARAGVDLGRVTRILLSHGHLDHFGNAARIADATGAQVFIHPWDLAKVVGEARLEDLLRVHRGYFLRLGVPGALLDALQEGAASGPRPRYLDRTRVEPLTEGQVFHFQKLDGVILHAPGHTPGLTCLHVPSHRLLLADDHLLARVSPNPFLDLSQGTGEGKFQALVRYQQSARRVYPLELDCVLPGHGEAFRGHRSLLDGLFDFYARRQERLLARLRVAPATAYELLEVLFPRNHGPRLVLMLSEVVANLEVLEADGRVQREPGPRVDAYRPSA
jgi:glyoxylase-like metal-dependent hydrolase (beta-lactamase superfamily II)